MHRLSKNIIYNLFVLCTCFAVAIIIIKFTPYSVIDVFQTNSIFTYVGLLLGLSITVYTFSLTIVDSIRQKIETAFKNSPDQIDNNQRTIKRENAHEKLNSVFQQLKEDIWFILFSLLIVIAIKILEESYSNSNMKNICKTANITMFFYCTALIIDILRTLFSLGEITLHKDK